MLNEEEIRLKLGLDDKPLDEGTRRALAKLAQLGKESEKTFFEHGEKPARAFHKVLHQITEQFPLLGGAARIALSPIGGALAIATTAALTFRRELEELNRTMDQIGEANAGRLGNIPKAVRAALKGGAADRRQGTAELESFTDPLSEMVALAKTPEEKQAALNAIEGARTSTARKVLDFNNNPAHRDELRTKIEKSAATIAGAEGHLSTAESLATGLRQPGSLTKDIIEALRSPTAQTLLSAIPGANQFVQLATKGYNFSEDQKASLLQSLEAEIVNYKNQIEKESDSHLKFTEELDTLNEGHKKEVDRLKELDTARTSLKESIRTQAYLQQEYNLKYSQALRTRNEAAAAVFTPGLQELAGYSGPYAFLAREVLAGRDFAKRQMGFATPGELAGLRGQFFSAQNDLSTDLRTATTYGGRQAALSRYSGRIETLLTGKIRPEDQLAVANEHLKSIEEMARRDGLVVRGADNS